MLNTNENNDSLPNKHKNCHTYQNWNIYSNLSRDHVGFCVFLVFLLIAPKIPIYLPGGSERSSISLGFIGLIFWFLLCPNYLFRFPTQSLPVIILNFFAYYTVIISLASFNVISIIYSIQFLFYVVACSIFFRKYLYVASNSSSLNITLTIFFTIMSIYALGVLISVFTGPIYPWQTIYTLRPWGNLWIQQGVGFSEAQNVAAEILIIFATAAIYIYNRHIIKKLILICLALIALLSTLCRSPIIAFFIAVAILIFIENFYTIFVRCRIHKSSLYPLFALVFTVFIFIASLYLFDKHIFYAILSGFGFGENSTLISDLFTRLSLWKSGIDTWASSASVASIVFGKGFRSSMNISPESGAWLTSHNFFVTVLAEFGIVGLSIILLFFIASIFNNLNIVFLNEHTNTIELALARFKVVSILAIIIHNFAGEFLYSPVLISMLVFIVSCKTYGPARIR